MLLGPLCLAAQLPPRPLHLFRPQNHSPCPAPYLSLISKLLLSQPSPGSGCIEQRHTPDVARGAALLLTGHRRHLVHSSHCTHTTFSTPRTKRAYATAASMAVLNVPSERPRRVVCTSYAAACSPSGSRGLVSRGSRFDRRQRLVQEVMEP